MQELAALFKGLADETRLSMVALLLRHGELCVCDLEHTLGVTQSKASRHLRTLKAAGLLEDRRGAQWVFYRMARTRSPSHRVVLASLRRLLSESKTDELDRRLERWRARQQRAGETCGVRAPGPRRTRPRREARA